MEWQPIKTAPFEYVRLTETEGAMWLEWCLLFIPDEHGGLAIVGGMDADEWLGRNDDRSCFPLETPPTHWMPLPEPPLNWERLKAKTGEWLALHSQGEAK
jgi:hypothetical protein